MIIKRDKYLDKLVRKMNNGMVKVITGIRRSGKSFLLFNLFYDYLLEFGVPDSHIVKIALDDDEYAELRNPDALRKYINEKITDKEQCQEREKLMPGKNMPCMADCLIFLRRKLPKTKSHIWRS